MECNERDGGPGNEIQGKNSIVCAGNCEPAKCGGDQAECQRDFRTWPNIVRCHEVAE